MRWAYAPYPDGTTQGNADYYCHRVFQAKYAHQFKRKQFIEKLSSDSAVHDAFFEEVERFISEKKSGKALVRGVATGKTGSEHIVADKTVQQKVIMPQPKFYPRKVYIRKFGADPKKHGHAFTTLHGTMGVLVPADEDEPWTIEPSIATSLTQSKVVDDGEDRVDEGDLEKKFKDLQDMKQAELNIKGKSYSKMMDVEAPLAQEDEGPPAKTTKQSAQPQGPRLKRRSVDSDSDGGPGLQSCFFSMQETSSASTKRSKSQKSPRLSWLPASAFPDTFARSTTRVRECVAFEIACLRSRRRAAGCVRAFERLQSSGRNCIGRVRECAFERLFSNLIWMLLAKSEKFRPDS